MKSAIWAQILVEDIFESHQANVKKKGIMLMFYQSYG